LAIKINYKEKFRKDKNVAEKTENVKLKGTMTKTDGTK